MTTTELLLEAARDAAAVLLPVRCSGCGAPDRSVCIRCRRALRPEVGTVSVAGIPAASALTYDGVARRVLLAYKESGRVDAAPVLATALRDAVRAAVRAAGAGEGGPPVPVLVPSTRAARRTRGFHPTGLLLARARVLGPPLRWALRPTRQAADQAGLSAAGRVANRSGSMVASPRVRGRRCLIVDDIVTTGSTAAEAARAITAEGGIVVGLATLARTPRRDAT